MTAGGCKPKSHDALLFPLAYVTIVNVRLCPGRPPPRPNVPLSLPDLWFLDWARYGREIVLIYMYQLICPSPPVANNDAESIALP